MTFGKMIRKRPYVKVRGTWYPLSIYVRLQRK